VTLAVVATLAIAGKSKSLQFQFVAVTLGVTELLERVKAQPNGGNPGVHSLRYLAESS
jgi:hypothetical protein